MFLFLRLKQRNITKFLGSVFFILQRWIHQSHFSWLSSKRGSGAGGSDEGLNRTIKVKRLTMNYDKVPSNWAIMCVHEKLRALRVYRLRRQYASNITIYHSRGNSHGNLNQSDVCKVHKRDIIWNLSDNDFSIVMDFSFSMNRHFLIVQPKG